MIIITGGAGYIGRHVAAALRGPVTIVDDLRRGNPTITPRHPLVKSDIAQYRPDWPKVDAVIHCAGSIEVGESVLKPDAYWANNVGAGIAFFSGAPKRLKVVFSSSAAVYGEPASPAIVESHPARPVNPYGWTKLVFEQFLGDLGVQLTVLRYFNAAGGSEDHLPESHLIPRVLDAAMKGTLVSVYGDGSNVRDYVHVEDLAEAHVKALDCPGIYNLGSGKGSTVLEVIDAARRVTGKRIEVKHEAARPGDPKRLVADISKARRELGWEPKKTLEEILASGWDWKKRS